MAFAGNSVRLLPNLRGLLQRWQLLLSRVAARKLFSLATEGLSCIAIDGIPVYHQTDLFRDFVGSAFRVLQDSDRLDYDRLKKGLVGVVELDGPPDWANQRSTYTTGFQIGVFLDEFTAAERAAFGFRRYAATLAGFAIRRRIATRLSQKAGWVYTDLRNKRILEIARKRELSCCEMVGCDAKHICNMQRLVRNG